MKEFVNTYIVPMIAYLLVRLISKTVTVKVIGKEHEDKILAEGSPRILSFWHGQLFLLPRYYKKSASSWEILVSPSVDGEVIARTLQWFGYGVVRGSSFKSSRKALLALKRHVEDGKSVVLIADGSRGPYQKLQPGALMVSKLSGGVPALPIAISYSNEWKLNSWDKLAIPKPFSKAVVVYGEPVSCPTDANSAILEEARARLEQTLLQITEQAEIEAKRDDA